MKTQPAAAAACKPIFAAAKKAQNVLELLVYDEIGQGWYSDGVTPDSVQKAIKEAGQISAITVRINSPGGSSFDGVTIHNILRRQGVPVHVIVEGLAASAAFTVAMAGDKISVCDGAMMMLHNAWTIGMGDARSLRALADTLEKVSSSMRDFYAKRSGETAEQVQLLMDAETWMDAKEAVAKGFADEQMSTTAQKTEEAQSLIAQFDLSKFAAKVPDTLKFAKHEWAVVPIAARFAKAKTDVVVRVEVKAGGNESGDEPVPEHENGTCECDCQQCVEAREGATDAEHCYDRATGCYMDADEAEASAPVVNITTGKLKLLEQQQKQLEIETSDAN
jgi:ATP-dependent Clp protease protease subunit